MLFALGKGHEEVVIAMKKILIVEDEIELLELIKTRLEANGFVVIETKDGQEALDKVFKEKPDLIVLDLMLPKIDGGSVCNQLKKSKEYCHIPILMLTAKDAEADIRLGKLQGADWYMSKPFDPGFLILKINELLKKAGSLKTRK